MMINNDAPNLLTLGYNLDAWNNYNEKIAITTDISRRTNSHILVVGMSGSGKSYAGEGLIGKLAQKESDGLFWLGDYKGDDNFAYLRDCTRYRSFRRTSEALDAVYNHLNARLSGEDKSRNQITLAIDEYIAFVLALQGEDKDKKPAERLAPTVMNRVSELLLMGRSMGVRLCVFCQRPDALAFPAGSRLNYGVVMILGAAVRSIYEMCMPDHLQYIEGRQFGRGEGVVLLQGSELHVIKIPTARDENAMREICKNALM